MDLTMFDVTDADVKRGDVAVLYGRGGMPLEKILQAVTIHPAKALHISDHAGSLKPRMPADIAIFDIHNADRLFADNYGNSIQGNQIFVPLMTMIDGRIAYRQIFF